ncbi:RNA polymerase sigma-70 factor, ECF subfamily [Mycolicibacterium rutilum]|uniref:RNA polymerase sigma-70 factor, ECF subfamily n=1 Tax=Mycolicibacterium rutilum TaxID=370526 RepID=A0A1H6IVA0_MYCRU|nr:sigma-70 family RNA polymerase sigma factor [Mycolicibacterium rutilum]SEH53344.1 RNA polymerase sigma-70 factor, ECF subfamily [Mycolicibacterium rutilum]
MDAESREWLRILDATCTERDTGIADLHAQSLRVAHGEVRRRQTPITGTELDDIAAQAASDATMAILGKLATFRGESRFTTWAYKFVILEVANKIGRHYWRNPPPDLDVEDWNRLPERFGVDPSEHAEAAELTAAIRQAVETTLTERQRQMFVDIVLRGIPLDALVDRLGTNRNAIYKTVFEARRKIRDFLVANEYLTNRVALDKT